ncbi:hypothetical protein VCEM1626_003705A, partial [Vibrio cholerae O1 str. EM-1626]
MRGKIL